MADNNNPSNGGRNGNGNGLIRSGAGVANRAISALAGTPMLLVLTLLNAGMFGMMTYLIVQSAQFRYAERAELIQLLRNCVERHLNKQEMQDLLPKIDQNHAIEIQLPKLPKAP